MYDELTEVDIQKMEEEIRYRREVLGPKLGEELRRTREFGDLSENAEYKEAKREKRSNDARIRYLENMIRTAHVIDKHFRPVFRLIKMRHHIRKNIISIKTPLCMKLKTITLNLQLFQEIYGTK